MIIDLHMHSNVSDGKLSPADLVRLVHANGVELMALTDHDTMDGVRQASAAAEELGVGFIPGVEISTGWGGRVVHIVGLGVDPDAPGIDAFFSSICTKRDRRGRLIGERFEQLYGIRGAYEGALSLADNKDNLFPHSLRTLAHAGGRREEYQEAFDRFLKTGEALLRRHRLAGTHRSGRRHPQFGRRRGHCTSRRYSFSESWMLDEFLKAFRDAGGEAIEVCSGSQSRDADVFFADVARRMDFLASSGSDWHAPGTVRPMPGTQPQIPEDLTPVWRIIPRRR